MIEKYVGKIKAVSKKNYATGQIGFSFNPDAHEWYNINGSPEILDILLKESIVVGNEIEFNMGESGIENLKVTKKLEKQEKSGNWAEDMTCFEDLLTAAHEKGLISINTELIQIDSAKKFAVFKAIVKGMIVDEKKQRNYEGTFTGYGDAEGIDNDKIKPHWIRMSETRAIVRALRWYTNNAAVSSEETGN